MFYSLSKLLCTLFFRIYGGFNVIGRENFPVSGSVIVACNHVSYVDPPALGCAAPRRVHFMAKEPLFRVPGLNTVIRALGAFPVRQHTADLTSLRTALRILKEGGVVALFPEGSRSVDGILRPAEPGVGLIVRKSRARVIPAAVEGTGRMLYDESWFPRPARIQVTFGSAMEFTGDEYEGRDGAIRISDRIMTEIAALLKQPPPPSCSATEVSGDDAQPSVK